MHYNKCYQCQTKDQVLGTSFCSIECKELWLKNEANRPKIDNFAEKLKRFREEHLTPKTEFEEAVDYMEKIFTAIPDINEPAKLQDNGVTRAG